MSIDNVTPDGQGNNIQEDPSAMGQEQALWSDFKRGDVGAYALIYKKYFFPLYSYGKKTCADPEMVKDCIQDLFVKIWNNRQQLSDTTSVKYYLFTSLKRKLLDTRQSAYCKNKADEELLDVVWVEEEESGHPQKEKVLAALNRLSANQQKLLRLKYNDALSNQEIAREMGISIQSVYNGIFKTLRAIRKQIF